MSFQDHFSNQAANYVQARPSYPPALFAYLANLCRHHELAWDAGCGNGQASVRLAEYFSCVFASDPSTKQIENATPHPQVRYAVEAAEHCSLPSRSADLVIVAQAMHWFDVPRFQAEARHVLRAEGIFAAWTYALSRVNSAVDAVFDELHHSRLEDYWPTGREHVINAYRDLPFAFTPIAAPTFEMRCEWTLTQYLAYLRSWSACQRYLQKTGRDPVTEISDAMQTAWGDRQTIRTVRWPLSLKVGHV